jgi:hypothetical protein
MNAKVLLVEDNENLGYEEAFQIIYKTFVNNNIILHYVKRNSKVVI